MSFIRRLLSKYFLYLENRFKGTRTLRTATKPHDMDLLGTLIGYSVTGYEIKIFCNKIRYHQKYSRWYVPSTNIDLYRVYSTTSQDAPDSLKKACSLEITIPPPRDTFFSDEFQKDAAIEWYLDLLTERMSPEDRFNG